MVLFPAAKYTSIPSRHAKITRAAQAATSQKSLVEETQVLSPQMLRAVRPSEYLDRSPILAAQTKGAYGAHGAYRRSTGYHFPR
ncbi:uncharacterized protein BDW70DRAFT_134838 [Aspergillus foveolatus]|uniref:uncharacterized protein n=1 Tax=Aspergillus foveolatus TaxID=210207 RepID=UPI003CCCE4A7